MQDTDKELGQYLVNHGIAWIGVYSYDSRGLKWLTYKERLTKSNIFDQVSDAYRVLDYIENDARFDENNVAVTGFSLGGMSSLMTASQSMTEQFKIGKKDFSFALNQYGPCFVSPSDPKPDYRVFSLWGENDA
jgi:dienelactone hydrolase